MVVDTLVTLKRFLLALLGGTSFGFALAILLMFFDRFRQTVETGLAALMTVPGMALAPLAIVLLGFGDLPIVVVGLVTAIFPMAYSTLAGLQSVNPELLEAGRVDGASDWQVVWLVQVPASKGAILTGLELSLAKSWRTVIAVEFVAAANYGLGYAIWDAAEYLRFDTVAVGIAIVMVGHWLLNRLVRLASGKARS